MQDPSEIIRILNQPGPHSGTLLGSTLGVSRMAVQKRVQALVDLGLPVTASSGVGYVLEEGVRLLEAESIRTHLDGELAGLVDSIDVLQSTPSTNSYLLTQPILNGRVKVCLAESQSAGRGRRGNDWESAAYRNVMLSLSWGFGSWPTTITGLGLAVGLVVAEYLNIQYDAGVSIKWPNDLLVGNDKLGGILIDVAGETSGVCNVVIGLGLNVHQADWSQSSDYKWTDLRSLGVDVDRNVLVAELVSVIAAMLTEFDRTGFTPLIHRWNALSSYAGKAIRIGNANGWLHGEMLGVDELGALLLVDKDGRKHRIDDSSLSVRLV